LASSGRGDSAESEHSTYDQDSAWLSVLRPGRKRYSIQRFVYPSASWGKVCPGPPSARRITKRMELTSVGEESPRGIWEPMNDVLLPFRVFSSLSRSGSQTVSQILTYQRASLIRPRLHPCRTSECMARSEPEMAASRNPAIMPGGKDSWPRLGHGSASTSTASRKRCSQAHPSDSFFNSRKLVAGSPQHGVHGEPNLDY